MPEQVRICMRRVATNPTEFNKFKIYDGFCDLSAKMFAEDVRDMFGVVPIASLEVNYLGEDKRWYIDVQVTDTPNHLLSELMDGQKISYDRTSSETWEYTLQDRTQNLLLNSKKSITTYFSQDFGEKSPFTGDDNSERMYRNEHVEFEDLYANVHELEEKPIEPRVPPMQTVLSLVRPEEQPEEDL